MCFSFSLSYELPHDVFLIFFYHFLVFNKGFPGGSVIKNLPANAGDVGLNPGSGISPRERNGNSLQYSCLDNSID